MVKISFTRIKNTFFREHEGEKKSSRLEVAFLLFHSEHFL